MQWLREHGLIARASDFEDLPLPVLEDARLLMEAEWAHAAAERQKMEADRGRRR